MYRVVYKMITGKNAGLFWSNVYNDPKKIGEYTVTKDGSYSVFDCIKVK